MYNIIILVDDTTNAENKISENFGRNFNYFERWFFFTKLVLLFFLTKCFFFTIFIFKISFSKLHLAKLHLAKLHLAWIGYASPLPGSPLAMPMDIDFFGNGQRERVWHWQNYTWVLIYSDTVISQLLDKHSPMTSL